LICWMSRMLRSGPTGTIARSRQMLVEMLEVRATAAELREPLVVSWDVPAAVVVEFPEMLEVTDKVGAIR